MSYFSMDTCKQTLHSSCFLACITDQDGDKKLTLSEFISLPVGTVENQQAQDIDDDWVKDRKKEFEEVIDANHDGIVTMEELEVGDSEIIILFMYIVENMTALSKPRGSQNLASDEG